MGPGPSTGECLAFLAHSVGTVRYLVLPSYRGRGFALPQLVMSDVVDSSRKALYPL